MRRRPRVICVLAVLPVVTGCGATVTQAPAVNVSVRPAPVCEAVAERRDLAAALPDLSLPLLSADVDDFSGLIAEACNTRSIVYAADRRAGRPATVIGLFFGKQAQRLARTPQGNSFQRRGKRIDGAHVMVSAGPGTATARFDLHLATVRVSAACLPADLGQLGSCEGRETRRELRRRLLDAVRAVIAPLRAALG